MNTQVETATTRGSAGPRRVREQIVEIVSDSGEGAQKAGQIFGAVSAKMGNGVWTVEIIPAEIRPPMRSRAGASGIRIRFASEHVSNPGDAADLVIAFNEQVLYGRVANQAYRKGTKVLLESRWGEHSDPEIREQYAEGLRMLREQGLDVRPLPIDQACRQFTDNPKLGKNMFVLGMLCYLYDRDMERAKAEVAAVFRKKGPKVIEANHRLLTGGYDFASLNLEDRFAVPAAPTDQRMVVMNGNQALACGVMAAGIELVAMYPITPATSVSHHLADAFHRVGGFLHQAEDEIAAIGFAIGASYAGRTACTVTSGPGFALKMEFIGLAVMAEVPLVLLMVQRGGPSTGLPTKVEQSDLLTAIQGAPGDAPKIVIAPATIEECFHMVVLARKLAETFRTLVVVLSDANLATGVQPFPRPDPQREWFSSPVDQSEWDARIDPYDWDRETGLSPRPVPGQPGGEYVLTGLAHTRKGKVAYDPTSNQHGSDMRSRKLATLGATLKPPEVYGDAEGGDLLIVGWGSTLGAIREAVDRAREDGLSVSTLHLRFLSPLEPGLREIFSRFKRVMTVEMNYGDDMAHDGYRRRAQLAWLLRAETLVDVDSWSRVYGAPLAPSLILDEIRRRLA